VRKPIGEGLFPLTPLPVKDNDEIDYDAIRANIKWLRDNGFKTPHGFIVFGEMGAMYAVNEKEFNKVVDVSVEAAQDQSVVIGTWYQNTREAIRRTKYAEDAGADGAMICIPYAREMEEEWAGKYYQQINDAIKGDLAIMHYNYPMISRGFSMGVAFWKKYLLNLENVKAVKESTPSHDQLLFAIADKINFCPGGERGIWRDSMLGAKGSVAAVSWAAPKHMQYYWEQCCVKKNWFDKTVLKIYRHIINGWMPPTTGMGARYGMPLRSGTTSPNGGWMGTGILKVYVEFSGLEAGSPRAPYVPIPDAWLPAAKKWIEELRAIKLP
jgi:4-hydroxy-tetrahydrodipicolinate synthase